MPTILQLKFLKRVALLLASFFIMINLKGFRYNEENKFTMRFSNMFGHIWLSLGKNEITGKITYKILNGYLSQMLTGMR